jgi:hypothetical protein
MLWVVAIVVSGLVVNEGTTECEKTSTRFVQLLGYQRCSYHHAIEVTRVVNATTRIVEVFLLQIEVGIVFDTNEIESVDDGLPQ